MRDQFCQPAEVTTVRWTAMMWSAGAKMILDKLEEKYLPAKKTPKGLIPVRRILDKLEEKYCSN